MSILYLTSDLLFSSRVSQTAKQQGIDLQVSGAPDAAIASITADTRLVILDLTLPSLDVVSTVARLREANPTVRIVAYGPHVQAGKLNAARAAGCDEVLTRGQFDREIARVLA